MCSGHGLNSGITANFARDVTLKRSKGQQYVGLVLPSSELVHEIIDGPWYIWLWRACYCFFVFFFINLITKELKCYKVIMG